MGDQSVLIIAGEVSGEEIALGFIPQLLAANPELNFFGVGGDNLSRLGMDLIFHLKDFSTWGISGAISKIPFYLNSLNLIEKECIKRQTKVAILIDFQTFNFKLAKRLSKKGIKVLYVVAPQAWAWKSWRAKQMSAFVHSLFCLIPFEVDWFKSRGLKRVFHINHPMLAHLKKSLKTKTWKNFAEIKKEVNILLLPGSRKFEVQGLLSEFLNVVSKLKNEFNINLGILKSQGLEDEIYDRITRNYEMEVETFSSADKAFSFADLCLACSGTITLCCALFELPTIVCYRSSLLNQFIFETFVNYKGPISLGNIMNRDSVSDATDKIYPELIQDQVSFYNIYDNLLKLLTDQERYEKMRSELKGYEKYLTGQEIDLANYLSNEIGKL